MNRHLKQLKDAINKLDGTDPKRDYRLLEKSDVDMLIYRYQRELEKMDFSLDKESRGFRHIAYFVQKYIHNMFDDHIYNDAEKIVVHNTEEVDALLWIADYTGWCEFEQITSPGTWVRHAKDMGTHYLYSDGIWEKE